MKTFGKLRNLRKETARIDRIIEVEFGRIELRDRDQHFDFVPGLERLGW